jgi:hypothetical protein
MKRMIYFLFLVSNICFSQDSISANILVTPRNTNKGIFDNGLLDFDINSKNKKISVNESSFYFYVKIDSVFEFVNIHQNLSTEIINSFNNSLEITENNFDTPRIKIILNGKDEIAIDRNYNACFNKKILFLKRSKYYKLNDQSIEFLLNQFPIELKENWKYDIRLSPDSLPSEFQYKKD